jgi:hypothetical protein
VSRCVQTIDQGLLSFVQYAVFFYHACIEEFPATSLSTAANEACELHTLLAVLDLPRCVHASVHTVCICACSVVLCVQCVLVHTLCICACSVVLCMQCALVHLCVQCASVHAEANSRWAFGVRDVPPYAALCRPIAALCCPVSPCAAQSRPVPPCAPLCRPMRSSPCCCVRACLRPEALPHAFGPEFSLLLSAWIRSLCATALPARAPPPPSISTSASASSSSMFGRLRTPGARLAQVDGGSATAEDGALISLGQQRSVGPVAPTPAGTGVAMLPLPVLPVQVALSHRILALRLLMHHEPLIALPSSFSELYNGTIHRRCSVCGTVPMQPAVCLLCGELVCAGSDCCRSNGDEECCLHAQSHHRGVGIFLVVRTTQTLLVIGRRFCW